MQFFFSPFDTNDQIELVDAELQHIKVLRKREGDNIAVLNGKGDVAQAIIISLEKKRAIIGIETIKHEQKQSAWPNLVIAPTKNMNRNEWIVEKAIEIGCESIQFVCCENSERKQIKLERLEKIAISALKQSGSKWLPAMKAIMDFDLLIDQLQVDAWICSCFGDRKPIEQIQPTTLNPTIFIGPEGGFSSTELNLAVKNGIKPIIMGNNRLRTETAAIVALSQFKLKQI